MFIWLFTFLWLSFLSLWVSWKWYGSVLLISTRVMLDSIIIASWAQDYFQHSRDGRQAIKRLWMYHWFKMGENVVCRSRNVATGRVVLDSLNVRLSHRWRLLDKYHFKSNRLSLHLWIYSFAIFHFYPFSQRLAQINEANTAIFNTNING